MKKIIALFLAAVLICSFSACTKNQGSADNTESKQSTTAESTEAENSAVLVNDCVSAFFESFEKGDFKGMQNYCSQEFFDWFYQEQEGTFSGAYSASLISVGSVTYNSEDNEYNVDISYEITPSDKIKDLDKERYETFSLKIENEKAIIVDSTTG